MVEKLKTEIVISVFYNHSSWVNLIKDIIKPFLNQELDKGCISTYDIYLSTSLGDHNTMGLKLVGRRDELEQRFLLMLDRFCSENPSTEYPFENFFVDHYDSLTWFNTEEVSDLT